jgi:hypothetical protein
MLETTNILHAPINMGLHLFRRIGPKSPNIKDNLPSTENRILLRRKGTGKSAHSGRSLSLGPQELASKSWVLLPDEIVISDRTHQHHRGDGQPALERK